MATNGTFTAMSDDGIQAVIDAQAAQPDQYELSLNNTDFEGLVQALAVASEFASIQVGSESLADWASSFLSSIASTLDIEFV